ncbi:MAG TPA: dihydrofolate reductase family protein [Gemmatimonadaceae bacterium]|nr:dihydrofolate reductase family protein [Gemmatimonadaceae bacterium]
MRPRVICHMMPSVDGRLRTQRWDIPEAGHNEYERTADTYHADAWLCGRKTMEEFASGRARPRTARPGRGKRDDFVIRRQKGEKYAVALDAHGKLRWKSNKIEGDPLIVVVADDIAESHLEELRVKQISYILAPQSRGVLRLAPVLDKLAAKFGVRKLMLEGGGETNGLFLKQGLVDELSLLLTPVVDGAPGEPALFDVEEGGKPAKAMAKLRLKNVRRAASGMLWVKYGVQDGRGRQAATAK